MSWKHWAAVLTVIGAGILLQVPRDEMPAHHVDGASAPVSNNEMHDHELGPFRTVDLEVTGMTCESCPTTAQVAVERVEGVREARFSYPEGEGIVTYDTTATSVAEIIRELDRMTDFSATERIGGGR